MAGMMMKETTQSQVEVPLCHQRQVIGSLPNNSQNIKGTMVISGPGFQSKQPL